MSLDKALRHMAVGALVFCCAAAASADMLLVGNKSGHTLWALDLASGERLASFETGRGPHEVEVSPDRRLAVVSNYGEREDPGNTLSVIDLQAGKVARVMDLGEDTRPHGMAFLPDGRLAVTTEGSGRLLVVDPARGEVLQKIAVGEGVAHMVAVSHAGRFAWVTNISAGTLEKVDLEAGKVVGTVKTGAGAEGVGVAAQGREVWVTNRANDTISVVDADSMEIVATLASPGFPIRVAVTPDGRHALVTNARAATLAVFDVAQRAPVATVQIADPDEKHQRTLLGDAALPIGIAVHPDGARAFVAISGANEVAVVETGSWQVAARWATGREPDALGVVVTDR